MTTSIRPLAKETLLAELSGLLLVDLETLERAYRGTREAATHEEAKPENDKDTRALEQSYLARGQAARIEELKASLAEVKAMSARAFGPKDPVALGALVTVDQGGAGASILLIAPHGGGARLGGGLVQVVTPRSPLGHALVGKRAGEESEVLLAGKTRVLTVVKVD